MARPLDCTLLHLLQVLDRLGVVAWIERLFNPADVCTIVDTVAGTAGVTFVHKRGAPDNPMGDAFGYYEVGPLRSERTPASALDG